MKKRNFFLNAYIIRAMFPLETFWKKYKTGQLDMVIPSSYYGNIQRAYSWTAQQAASYCQYGFEDGLDSRAVSIVQKGKTWLIMDGKHRLTALFAKIEQMVQSLGGWFDQAGNCQFAEVPKENPTYGLLCFYLSQCPITVRLFEESDANNPITDHQLAAYFLALNSYTTPQDPARLQEISDLLQQYTQQS